MRRTLDLFSGIGGFSLGLEATDGFRTDAFVEIDPYCQRVLRRHWPHTAIYPDVTRISIEPGQFDVLCGGFPCQDISVASGQTASSLVGARSGLWFEFARLIHEGQPTWVIIENVEALRNKGLTLLLWQLAEFGYDAEWNIIPAYAVGKPHRRRRLWIVAHSHRNRLQGIIPFPLQRLRDEPWDENRSRATEFLQGWNNPHNTLLNGYNGIPSYVDQCRALGNAIIPDIAYKIGQAIIQAEEAPDESPLS